MTDEREVATSGEEAVSEDRDGTPDLLAALQRSIDRARETWHPGTPEFRQMLAEEEAALAERESATDPGMSNLEGELVALRAEVERLRKDARIDRALYRSAEGDVSDFITRVEAAEAEVEQWKSTAAEAYQDGYDQGAADAQNDVAGQIEAAEAALAAARAQVARVEALHHSTTVPAITSQNCLSEACDHEDECPTSPVEVCAACWEFADDVDAYYGEECLTLVLWPCPTARALAEPAPEAPERPHGPNPIHDQGEK